MGVYPTPGVAWFFSHLVAGLVARGLLSAVGQLFQPRLAALQQRQTIPHDDNASVPRKARRQIGLQLPELV